jgi:V/A-type H+-transporting ATPase subunit I
MKKVSLVVQEKNRGDSLVKLRDLGLMHLEKREVSSDSLSKLMERKTKIETAQGILRPYETQKKGNAGASRRSGDIPRRRASDAGNPETEPYSADAVDAPERPELVTLITDLGEERKALQDQFILLSKEKSRIENWGDFRPGDIKALAEMGIPLYPYEIGLKNYAALPDDTKLIVLGRDKSTVYAVVLDKEIPGENPFMLPEHSLSEISGSMADIQVKLAEIEKRLDNLSGRKPFIEAELKKVRQQIDFESASAGMEVLADVPVAYTVSWLTGFVPQDDMGLLKRAAAENNWALISDDPGPDDAVPTKLKNNRLVSLIYPLTDFLEVVPGYHEVDISGWFLLFFCIFFGMIFGDAGYGLLLMLIGIIGVSKTAKKGVPGGLKMLLLLSASNFVWGLLTCTWFGIDPANLPGFFRDISLPLISGANPDQAYVSENLQVFCFSLALCQLSIAHLKGIAANRKSLKGFGEVGSLAMLWGIYPVVLYLVVNNTRFPFLEGDFLNIVLGLVGGGFALTFIFAGYEGSVGRSILTSLKNIISVILGITNVFSDIMSYIRLWAVGLAGASISATVNTMAGPLLGNFLIFLGIILLVFGHGLNVILNVLSVLVHGVRLNTLEFSGHLGLTWSGTAYRPFAKTANN